MQAIGKLDYVQGKSRPKVECILCSIKEDSENVISLKIYEDDIIIVVLNLYPYNPGHLMIIPNRHITKFNQLTPDERNLMFELVIQCQQMIEDLLTPNGFNVGYNEGLVSGASIEHIHIHVVPRYKSELGFIDIIGQAKIIIQPLSEISFPV